MAYVELERSAERQPVTTERVIHAVADLGKVTLIALGRITPFSGNLPDRPLASHGDHVGLFESARQHTNSLDQATEPAGWPNGYFTPRLRYTDYWALEGSHPDWQRFPSEAA